MSLQDAPVGAPIADCAVCGYGTYLRLVIGDGHVPLCGDACERAWPRVELARNALAYLIRRVQSDPEFHYHMDLTESLARIIEARAALGGETADELREIVSANRPQRKARCSEDRDRAEALEHALEQLIDDADDAVPASALDVARAALEAE